MPTLRALVESRIKDEVADFREVGGAAGLGNILAGRIAASGCYVYQEGSDAAANKMVNIVSQRETVQLAVVITVKNVQDARGGDADDVSQSLRDSVRAALLGWEPEGYEMIEKVGHKLISFANGYLITKDVYRTAHQLRSI
ncbi:hypothetical protein [Methylomicrobium sp. Wu6]|uniref:phage tail terminator protein n=1 Tax=Methylomicrobium sp. Wu6 TaxID=3107928 RepID=UPI002DD66DDD|nr:hypothetical protein [Methylomicrobium sp. Wu6]MEC4750048.1 hypothetical protein [Methylomicrobium sp. Wu6]